MNKTPAGKSHDTNAFWSILELILDDEPSTGIGMDISDLATAVETSTFYIWDRFQRFRQITPDTTDEYLIRYREQVLNELAGGIEGVEYNENYYRGLQDTACYLNLSGWRVSDIPDFSALRKSWQKKNTGGHIPPPKPKLPRSDAGIYKITYSALLYATDGDIDFLNEIADEKTHSGNTETLKKKLNLGQMDYDTFKPFIDKAVAHGKTDFPKDQLDELRTLGKHRDKTKISKK